MSCAVCYMGRWVGGWVGGSVGEGLPTIIQPAERLTRVAEGKPKLFLELVHLLEVLPIARLLWERWVGGWVGGWMIGR